MNASADKPLAEDVASLTRFHLLVAWWSLLAFITLGVVLEGLHAWKVSDYLGRDAKVRRLMWTLSHAHGTLVALVHAAFAFTLHAMIPIVSARIRLASRLILAAGTLLPVGFFLGGVFVHESDPGVGVWLVPLGAGCLILGVLLVSLETLRNVR